jgi:hypothetical protein
LVAVLIVALAVTLVNLLLDPQGDLGGNRDPYILDDRIVYVCDEPDRTDQICVINTDGTGWRMLTNQDSVDLESNSDSMPYVAFSNPTFNKSGDVVWSCSNKLEIRSRTYLCHTKLDQPQGQSFVSEFWEGDAGRSKINEIGQILYQCGALLCFGELAGNTSEFDNSSTSDLIGDLNDSGDIVFTCSELTQSGSEQFFVSDVCLMDSKNLSGIPAKLTNAPPDGIVRYSAPSINNLGQVVFQCAVEQADETWDRNVCLFIPGAPIFSNLSANTPSATNSFAPSFSAEHQVIFKCREADGDSEYNLCKINADGTEYFMFELPYSLSTNDSVSVNNGKIVFDCGREICLINDDGTEFRRLTPP